MSSTCSPRRGPHRSGRSWSGPALRAAPRAAAPRAAALACAALAVLGACAHDYGVEDRQTPVHVWITAPDLAATGGTIDALVYVGPHKAVEGPIHFPPGVAHVSLPSLHVPAGPRTVSAVLQGGALTATKEVSVSGETWIQVLVRGRTVEIAATREQPRTAP